MKHTRSVLKSLEINDVNSSQGFQSLRMRTGKDTEYIVTEYVTPTAQQGFILVTIQKCKFDLDTIIGDDEEEVKE